MSNPHWVKNHYEYTGLVTEEGCTQRGFKIVEFEDRYGEKCSLQESSLATEAAIWFGIDDPWPQVFVPNEGWKEYPRGMVPEAQDILCSGRMHLTQEQVKVLLPYLQHFAETGCVPIEEDIEESE